jgi:hypothetical protein
MSRRTALDHLTPVVLSRATGRSPKRAEPEQMPNGYVRRPSGAGPKPGLGTDDRFRIHPAGRYPPTKQ